MEERDYIILRSYRSVWKIERKIYSIEGIKLLFPVSPNEVLYFAVSILIAYILTKVVPFLGRAHFIFKYGLIPFGIMKFLTKQKLDGKMPHKFFFDYLIFIFSPKQIYKFKPVDKIEKAKFVTPIVMKDIEIKDRTKEALKNKEKRAFKFNFKKLIRKGA
ncbi:MAG: hypothetical protein PWQ37_2353 [Candidatus Petromonas sp.]|jgi:hypothetical protein|nr:hypothetical protein [Candidatus Petromonas sp.]